MRPIIITFLLTYLIIPCCSAQPEPSEDVERRSKPRPPTTTISVVFIANDTCNLVINGRNYGIKNSPVTIKLPAGSHRLLFESLETGETIIRRSFRLTKDSAVGGRYTYTVMFKQ
jgi:hypothetical protein